MKKIFLFIALIAITLSCNKQLKHFTNEDLIGVWVIDSLELYQMGKAEMLYKGVVENMFLGTINNPDLIEFTIHDEYVTTHLDERMIYPYSLSGNNILYENTIVAQQVFGKKFSIIQINFISKNNLILEEEFLTQWVNPNESGKMISTSYYSRK